MVLCTHEANVSVFRWLCYSGGSSAVWCSDSYYFCFCDCIRNDWANNSYYSYNGILLLYYCCCYFCLIIKNLMLCSIKLYRRAHQILKSCILMYHIMQMQCFVLVLSLIHISLLHDPNLQNKAKTSLCYNINI